MSDSKQSRKTNRFFAEFIAKLRKWLNKIGSSIHISRRFVRQLLGATKGQGRKAKNSAGFILPTVAMVSLVVTLLVVATLNGSSDRAKSAANSRATQVFSSAGTPIIDRARAKIDALLTDDKLPRTTPPELILDSVITGDGGKYTFPDETRLQVVYNIDGDSAPKIKVNDGSLANREYVSTAWKFPIDTDNNGKFDTYGLYSILFRARIVDPNDPRPISPLEVRSLPMDESVSSGACAATGGVTNIATNEGWTKSGNLLKKSFFVYSITIPIKDAESFPKNPTDAKDRYEVYNGTTAVSALELQRDHARSPQNNNAVIFDGDTELTNVATFRLNGRVTSGGNLMVGSLKDQNVTFYQVSSSGDDPTDPKKFGSCYYTKVNSEILVAGNVVEGDASFSDTATLSPDQTQLGTGGNIKVHLFQGLGIRPDQADGVAAAGSKGPQLINEKSQSVDPAVNPSKDLALNDFAYSRRIKALVDLAIARGNLSVSKSLPAKTLETKDLNSVDPPSVMEDLVKRILDEGLSSSDDILNARRTALSVYFKERTRKVAFGEVPLETPENIPASGLFDELTISGQTNKELVPRRDWMLPTYQGSNYGRSLADFSNLTTNAANFDGSVIAGSGVGSLKLLVDPNDATKLALAASAPDAVISANKEFLLGDRVLVGNNLPARWLKYDPVGKTLGFVSVADNSNITTDSKIFWNGSTTSQRYRNTRANPLSNIGASDRGGFWELSASANPAILDSSTTPIKYQDDISPRFGGLRVVTNSGIYSRRPQDTFLPRYRNGYTDNPATTGVDESIAPLWNGKPQDNPITKLKDDPETLLNELNFTNFVVWQDSMPMTSNINPDTGVPDDPRKGDLQMRATALYHYKYSAFDSLNATTYQLPFACVSSYYDPSTPDTAKNYPGAPWNAGNWGRSNNGIVYDVKFTASDIDGITYYSSTGLFGFGTGAENPADKNINLADRLAYQANLMFPNGRFANERLRNVLIKLANSGFGKLTLPEQSTLDSNICALTILDGTSTADVNALPTVKGGIQIPHGAFREASFLDAREVKSLNANESLTEAANGKYTTATLPNNGLSIPAKNRADIYDLPIEQRQPLEIRVTDIDLDRLRGATVTGQPNNNSVTGVPTEYLLPYSGLVYATREDALADLSYYDVDGSGDPKKTDLDTRKTFSPLDFLLDPTRRPSGVRLINGYRLWRSALITGNLTNTDGTVAVSDTDYTKTAYKFSDTNKGEKGLTLVSNLPVYVKAQYDPKSTVTFIDTNSATAPGFNKHTQEEFMTPLNETISPAITAPKDIAASTANIWSNFYTRHADNGTGDKLNPNFACRPDFNINCTVGDEWRSTTIIADAATVLSANFLDGYRRDGDFDLRNNANTSTSINWLSLVNDNADKTKDSNYVLDRRRLGFFNNNFLTSFNWMRLSNSDGKQWTTTQPTLWMGSPQTIGNQFTTGNKQTKVPQNGNMSSYNANGVTPVQRRLNFHEYGMEMCRKFPLEECTFSDWIKGDTTLGAGSTTAEINAAAENSAGTTVLPTIAGTPPVITTPLNAPRYISATNWRYPRRVSFLRYDDLYKDGNMQLVMGGQCYNAAAKLAFPIVLGVNDGNLATGYTYPQFLGIPSSLLDAANNNNTNSYGTVPCPEIGMTVEINSVPSNAEGRRVTFHKTIDGTIKDFSLRTQLGTDDLPDVSWGTGNDNGNNGNSALFTTGTVTSSPDNNEPIANGGNYYKEVLVNVPAATAIPAPQAVGISAANPPIPTSTAEYSTNNAVYRRFDFQIKLNNRTLLAANEKALVRVTLYPNGSAIPAVTKTALTVNAATSLKDNPLGPLTNKFNTTVPPQSATPTRTIRSASTTSDPSDNPGTNLVYPPAIPPATTPANTAGGGDYINRLYNAGGPSSTTFGKFFKTPQSPTDTTTQTAVGSVFPRLPIGNTTGSDSAAAYSSKNSTAIQSTSCPVDQYCTILSWTGPTQPTGADGTAAKPYDDTTKYVSVLVVRDSANENAETFRLTLDNVVRSGGGSIGYINTRTGEARIGVYDAGNPSQPTPCGTGKKSYRLSGYDDREFLGERTAATCATATPTATPTPTGGTGGGAVLPGGYFIRANGHLGAAYPFKFIGSDYRPFKPPSANNNTGYAAGRYRWGIDLDSNGKITNDAENRFPDIPEDPETLGEVPMLPADPALSPITNTIGTYSGMTNANPPKVDRALWYRTAEDFSNVSIGTSSRAYYQRDKSLYINNLGYPEVSSSSSNKANLNTIGRLMLPNTVCINPTTGDVDERCLGKTYAFGGNSVVADTLLNLNLPYNPAYPSDEVSNSGTTTNVLKKPATIFAVCGATGNSEKIFQPTQRMGRTDITSTTSTCPSDPRKAITNFIGTADPDPTLGTPAVLTGGVGDAGTPPALLGGDGLRSAKFIPGNIGTGNEFIGTIPDDSQSSTRTDATGTAVKGSDGSAIDLTLRAKNTFATNKVQVYNLTGKNTYTPFETQLGVQSNDSVGPDPTFVNLTRTLSGTITLRANCVSATDKSANPTPTACTPNSRRLGPSPVFILRADPNENIVFDGLKVQLDGVDPNNVFWIFPKTKGDQNLVFKASDPTKPNIVTGNFIGVMPATVVAATADNSTDLNILDKYTSFRGVRFLGFRAVATLSTSANSPAATPVPLAGVVPSTVMAAMTTVDQPELQPVLQLHFPNRTDPNTNTIFSALQPLFFDANNDRKDSGVNGFPQTNQGQWSIRPVRSEVNAYFVAGSSPSRNGISYTTSLTASSSSISSSNAYSPTANNVSLTAASGAVGEVGGGLNNFIRLLENWEAIPLKITGGFLQNTKSQFATAPYAATGPIISSIVGVNTFSDIQTIFMNPVLPNIRMSNFNLQYQSITPQRIPYFSAPIRLWGYDVAFLTQQPDRFAERFATAVSGSNEFFREVNADDRWLKALLCALEPANPETDNTTLNSTVNVGSKQKFGTKPENYTVRVLRGSDQPSYCTKKDDGTPNNEYGGTALDYE